MNLNRHSFVQESQLARWIGEDMLDMIRRASMDLHVPVPVANIPGRVCCVEGLFIGRIDGGAFSSLSDLIAEATGGKQQNFIIHKQGSSGSSGGGSVSLWRSGIFPSAGAAASALAAGNDCTRTTVGALGQNNAAGGDSLHLTTVTMNNNAGGRLLLIYDRIWEGLIALGSAATQTVTMTAARYASPGTGNFAFIANEGGATLTNVAHSWQLVYTDDAGNNNQSAPVLAGVASQATNRLDHAGFAFPLLAGDNGIRDLESIACSVNTLVAGSPQLVLAHPLAMIPMATASEPVVMDGINSAFNMVEILDDACVAFLSMLQGSTTATDYAGEIIMVSG